MTDAAALRSDPLWWMKLWPLVAFLLVQGVAFTWWVASVDATVRELERRSAKVEQAVEIIPDIRASLKAIERMVERLTDDRFGREGRP